VTQRKPVPRQMRTRSTLVRSPREKVLARRRLGLIVLGILVPVTLGIALYTGSTVFLIVTLVIDVLLAAYVAMLLSIKQAQRARSRRKWTLDPEDDDVRVV
jgi:Na+/H+-translocating membrane pyrophosphatase